MTNFSLKWHPQFRIEDVGLNALLFLGENDQFLVQRDDYDNINPIVQRNGKLADYLFADNNVLNQVGALQTLDQMLEDGILLKEDVGTAYRTPDFSIDHSFIEIDQRKICLLSQLTDRKLLTDFIGSSKIDADVFFVVVDDPLDERLNALAKQFKEEGITWMLYQLTGEYPMIGPLFGPSDASPCYSCLRHRLIQNNPVREWIRRKTDTHLPVPILVDRGLQKQAMTFFLENEDQRELQSQLYVFDSKKREGEYHHVVHNSKCYDCQKEPNPHPKVELKSSLRHSNNDGGHRVRSRRETIERALPLISPVSGILAEIKEISTNLDDNQLSIFQVGYFQNSYRQDDLSPDTFVQLALGKGVSKDQAMTSALGEAFERQAAQFQGNEEWVLSSTCQLEGRAICPHELHPFSEEQYHSFESMKGVSLSIPQWVKKYEKNIPLHWVSGWSLTNDEKVHLPLAHCYANTPYEDRDYSLYTHNGNAAGNTLEEAVLQGLLELIERDSVAIWWYNQVPRPEIDVNIIPSETRKVINDTLSEEWDYWLLDVSNDIGVVTTVSVGQHKTTNKFVLGFGSHIDPAIACQRALTEMYQLIVIKDKVTGPFDFASIQSHPFLFPSKKHECKQANDFKWTDNTDIKKSILDLVDALNEVDLEVYVVDYSRPEVPLKTVKVVVPGLCHFWPQFAAKRLCEVPVKMGWLSQAMEESLLNPMDLYL